MHVIFINEDVCQIIFLKNYRFNTSVTTTNDDTKRRIRPKFAYRIYNFMSSLLCQSIMSGDLTSETQKSTNSWAVERLNRSY